MAKLKKNARIEVFRVGTFTPMSGKALSFSASDLEAVAANYDPERAPAPIVVGHPKTDDPAFGWAGGFDFNADRGVLFADLTDIAPSFAEAVAAGQYKKVSMSFFQPNASSNPKPGQLYPKHIGFLGAIPPAVPGLKPVSFADHSDDEVITFEGTMDFGTFDAENVGTIFRGIRDWMIESFGIEKADEVIPSWRIDWVNDLDLTTDENNDSAGFAAPPDKQEKKEPTISEKDTAEFAARQKEQDERQAILDKREADHRHADNVSFAERMIVGEKLVPANRDKVVALLDAAAATDATVSFAEGGDAVDLAKGLRDILEAQPRIVNFGAHELGDDPVDFAENPQALADAATAYQSTKSAMGISVTIDRAVDAVLKGAK